ncbi:MAG TPA: Co2+/Mg2+ efflux protein ApaG [Burkholderiaceae bacterium]|jgi:ApaG protein|uniref:Co2+/Mg2+ efflux protein ApaG n=1 Tax=Candidatus Skiveiella danica TaxID=3386177 RepID=UPI0009CE204A|nr:Co2+/Mg2+ efflux protein ApaG [Comamonadaceae bacterium]MBK9198003.1 Co2+/Mg2+ efflux protein ApaG [Betaproteobacteria bacterium]OQC01460.1 MAG: CO2+/MG2+ efflux protein ApaG [Alphaproteobacteria bacterium ADurb.Bin100]HOF30242.1 Co2+/Mg2+ efflux protein ApaG [Burkholderiaceae bacterium]MBK6928436.1 Co2+/Mg2+ efflux protein ApaG [Comamonadaceae bacterium]
MSTPEIDVRVEPRYLPEESDPLQETYGFAYTITLSNHGEVPAQLISRHWIILDADGHREEVRGLGVVGHQPLLKPGEGFEYTSGCRLRTPTGTMEGTYFFVKEDGASFEVPIPRFTLDATGQTGGRVLH